MIEIDNKQYFIDSEILTAASHTVGRQAPETIKVRLKSENGTEVMPYFQAQNMANEQNKQLLSVIVKNGEIISEIGEIGKKKYQAQKQKDKHKQNQIKHKSHTISVSAKISDNDAEIKIRKAIAELKAKQVSEINIKFQLKSAVELHYLESIYLPRNQKIIEMVYKEFNEQGCEKVFNNKKLEHSTNPPNRRPKSADVITVFRLVNAVKTDTTTE